MSKKILIIDDDKLLLENLSGVFVKDGFEVETAENGALALEILKNGAPDFMLLDLIMPVMNGVDFIKEVGKLHPELIKKIMVMTNSEDMEHMAEVVANGINVYVNKSTTELNQILEMVKARVA